MARGRRYIIRTRSTNRNKDDDNDEKDKEYEDMRKKKRKIIDGYDSDELDYYKKQKKSIKNKIFAIENELYNFSNKNDEIPLRFKILLSNNTIQNKKIILDKFKEMQEDTDNNSKLINYVNILTSIPFGIYHKINYDNENRTITDYLNNVKKEFDTKIYGHTDTKEQILRILAQFISNPNANGYVIGIHGSMGVGKTKLIKDGIAKVLNFPFAFIPLGGINDSSYLRGFSYTYQGSRHGKILEEIIKAKVMNPIFFFDELDKVSTTDHGVEIINTLIHMTDSTQNSSYTDKFFENIELDLSKSLMFFTFNHIEEINPILRDRMIIIKANSYSLNDKIKLSRDYLIKDIAKSYNFNDNDIIIDDNNIEYLINKTTIEDGVRNLQRNINNIYSYINLHKYIKINDELISFPFTITKDFIDKYIIMKRDNEKMNYLSLYL